jgi:GAF domain-containing protein
MSATNNLEHLSELIQRQSRAFADLNVNMNHEQMAAVVARHMLPQSGRFLAISRLFYEGENLTGWKILATANRERSYEWDRQDILRWDKIAPVLRDSVANGKPYILASLKEVTSEQDSPELHNLLLANQVETYVNIPMVVDGKPIATLFIMSRQPTVFSPDEINTFANLGDQMATLIYARSLLDEARQSQQFALELVDTNRNIMQAETNEELAVSLLEALPETVSGLTIALFNKPLQPGEKPNRLETQFVASRTGIDALLVPDFIPENDAGLPEMLRRMRDTQIITMSASDPLAGVLPPASMAALRQQGALILTVIGLQTGKRIFGVLGLGSTESVISNETQTNSLRAIADQIATSLENRNLLEQTTATLEETRLLYDINRSILAAQDTLDVLRIFRFIVAPDAASVSHSAVTYDAQNLIQDFVTTVVVTPDDEQVIHSSLTQQIGQGMLQQLTEYWTQHQNSLDVIEDLEGFDGDYPLAEFSHSNGARSLINFPVRESGLVRELITITFNEPRSFDASQSRLYTSLSDQISIVLQNHRLLHDAQINARKLAEQVKRLKAVSDVTAGIVAATDEQHMLAASSEAIVKLLEIDHCGILLVDESNGEYGIVASEYPKQGAEGLKLSLVNNPLWDEFVSQASKSLMVVNRNNPRLKPDARAAMIALGTHSMAFVPIVTNNRIVGSVGLDMYDANRPFTPEMLELAQIVSAQINASLQNIRLLSSVRQGALQLNEQIGTLRQLQQLAADISAASDEKILLDKSVQDLQELLKADHCAVVLLNPDQMTGTVVSEYPAAGALGIQFSVVQNPLYKFIHNDDKQPVVINDVAHDVLLDDGTRGFLQGIGTQAVMILPLIVQHQVIGSIGVDIFTPERSFTTRMMELAQTVSSQIAIALQNLRLVQEAERRAEQLQHITAFSQSAQTILDIDATLRYMLIESSHMLPQNQISISLYDYSMQELRIVAQRVDGQTQLTPSGGEPIPITGQVGRVWNTGELLYIPDLRAIAHDMDPGVSLRSWLLLPVLARGRVTGLVSVGSDQPYAYSESDVNLFSQMVTQFSIVLENTESYRQSQRVARNESLVNDISSQLQRQLDIESMLNITATELGKALGARRARIRLGVQQGVDVDNTTSEVE